MITADKTVLVSADRELFGYIISQKANGDLNMSDFQKMYDDRAPIMGWTIGKKYFDILNIQIDPKNNDMCNRFYYLLKNLSFIKQEYNHFMKDVENQSLIKVLKEIGVYKTEGRGENKKTWINPYIALGIMMEMDPMIWACCVVWITDCLIFNRVDIAMNYKKMNSYIQYFPIPDYSSIPVRLNELTFGYHETDKKIIQRNFATAEQLDKQNMYQKMIIQNLEKGKFKSVDEIVNYLNNL